MISVRPKTKDAILEAAFTLLAIQPDASLSEISEKAGVGRATLHRHFSGREDLIRTLAINAFQEMDAAVEAACEIAATHTDALKISMATLIPMGSRYGFLQREPIYDDLELERIYAQQNAETAKWIEAAIAENGLPSGIPVSWYVRSFDGLLIAAWEAVEAQELTPDQAADLAWRSFTMDKEKT